MGKVGDPPDTPRGPGLSDGTWSARLTLGNDALNVVPLVNKPVRMYDDNGFTNDIGASVTHTDGAEQWQLELRQRMITARGGGMERTDQVDAWLRHAHTFALSGGRELTVQSFVDLAGSGDFGGLTVQAFAHDYLFKGRKIGHGLQTIYPEGRRFGVAPGVGIDFKQQLGAGFTFDARASGQVALGTTGLTRADLDLSLGWQHDFSDLVGVGASLGLRGSRITTVDPTLVIPGGYDINAPFLNPHGEVNVRVSHATLGFGVSVNEGGSGYNMGALSLGFVL